MSSENLQQALLDVRSEINLTSSKQEEWQPPADPDKREAIRVMLSNMINTLKSQGRPVDQVKINRLALINAFDKGQSTDPSVLYSNPVEGHPENTSYLITRGLIPFFVNNSGDALSKLYRAQDRLNEAQGLLAKANYAVSEAKTPQYKRAALAALRNLRD